MLFDMLDQHKDTPLDLGQLDEGMPADLAFLLRLDIIVRLKYQGRDNAICDFCQALNYGDWDFCYCKDRPHHLISTRYCLFCWVHLGEHQFRKLGHYRLHNAELE